MSPAHQYKKLENEIVDSLGKRLRVFWQGFLAFFKKVYQKGKQRFTVMFIPHSEKRIFNFQISVFTLIFIVFLLSVLLIGFIGLTTHFTTTNDQFLKMSNNLNASEASLESFKDEIVELRRVVKDFKGRMEGVLTEIGTEGAKNYLEQGVGGDLSSLVSLEDVELVLKAGAGKVSMNSAAVRDPRLVREAAKSFGSERITLAVDARRNKEMSSGFELVVSGGTKPVGKDAIAWAKECQELGAGVILPTSMDGDGTQTGYDLEFTKAISDVVDIPVVASGGAGKLEHFYEAVVRGGAQVLLAASVFHYRILSIGGVKEYLRAKGLQVNL